MRISPLDATDFYKTGHIRQYPPGTSLVYSNFTCRSDRPAEVLPDFEHKVVFFGLQGLAQWLLIDAWNAEFFRKPKDDVVGAYQRRMDLSLGKGAVDVSHVRRCMTSDICRCGSGRCRRVAGCRCGSRC
jgi:nicotinamide phosphoribosyltransferase